MRKLVIEIPTEPGELFDVVNEENKRCDGLNWGEMLEQVARLTMPEHLLDSGYAMRTPDEWQKLKDARIKAISKFDV